MTTTIHIKIDKKVKEQAEKLAKNNGLTVTALVNLSLRQTLNSGRIALRAETDELEPNDETKKILRQAGKDFKSGKDISPAFHSAEEAFNWLRKAGKSKWK